MHCENNAYTMKGLLYFSDGTDYVTKVEEGLGLPESDGETPDVYKRQDHVIVETARGVEYGNVVLPPRDVEDEKVIQPLKEVDVYKRQAVRFSFIIVM